VPRSLFLPGILPPAHQQARTPRASTVLYAQHDPSRASALTWRTGGDDELDLLFEFGDPLLALWQPASG
jgi:hypothetical protein